jgi:hypothetical protein
MNRTLPALLLSLALAACAAPTQYSSTPAYSKYTLEQVIEWSKAGEAPARIIARLDAANAFYPLTASELVDLRDKGVSPEVLDYIHDRYVEVVRHEERFGGPGRFNAPR